MANHIGNSLWKSWALALARIELKKCLRENASNLVLAAAQERVSKHEREVMADTYAEALLPQVQSFADSLEARRQALDKMPVGQFLEALVLLTGQPYKAGTVKENPFTEPNDRIKWQCALNCLDAGAQNEFLINIRAILDRAIESLSREELPPISNIRLGSINLATTLRPN